MGLRLIAWGLFKKVVIAANINLGTNKIFENSTQLNMFEGFVNVNELDGKHSIIKNGAFAVTKNYEYFLSEVLQAHHKESPLNHIQKIFLLKRNAVVELKKHLSEYP